MGYLQLGLIIWAVAGPALTGAVMLGREAIIVSAERKAARVTERAACDSRIQQIETAINAASDDATDKAIAAADAMEQTPDVPADLLALCNRSASCRSRRAP